MVLDTNTFLAVFATIAGGLGLFIWFKFRAAKKDNP